MNDVAGGHQDVDVAVIGGGFYGVCLALFLRSTGASVVLIEKEDHLLRRASRWNQARIHTGFHYPRSFVTATRSLLLHRRFVDDFPDAVVDDFQMLYAIARRRSKVSAGRFERMFIQMGAPIRRADDHHRQLFDDRMISAVFACEEWAFDHQQLERHLTDRLLHSGVHVHLGTGLSSFDERDGGVLVRLDGGNEFIAGHVFNVTYSQINRVLESGGVPPAALKHELTEIALVEPPDALRGVGVTVMDGPFFSVMPWPAAGLHSLSHVRYTPHYSWVDRHGDGGAHVVAETLPQRSRHAHMIRDASRFLPCVADARWVRSAFEVKTVLLKNELDDGRPILYHQQPRESRVVSVMGGKLDNVYDLFENVKLSSKRFADAHDGLLVGS